MMSFWIVPVSLVAVGALLVGDGDVEREQPRRRGVDGHRGVHLLERDAGEQRAHVAQMRDRHADLADLAARQLVVGVVAGLRRQIEGDGEAGLALGKVLAIELVGLGGGRVARIGADQPGLVALGGDAAAAAGRAWAGSWRRSSFATARCANLAGPEVQCKMQLRSVRQAVSDDSAASGAGSRRRLRERLAQRRQAGDEADADDVAADRRHDRPHQPLVELLGRNRSHRE